MTTGKSPPELLQAVVDLGRGMFGAAACSSAVLEPDLNGGGARRQNGTHIGETMSRSGGWDVTSTRASCTARGRLRPRPGAHQIPAWGITRAVRLHDLEVGHARLTPAETVVFPELPEVVVDHHDLHPTVPQLGHE
jgi:hypothetical protein